MNKIVFKLDDKVEKAMEELLEIENDFREKSMKPKKKRKSGRKESGPELYARMRDEELKRLGYIK